MTELAEATTVHGGRRLRYLIGGQGPPLLLCHGWLGSAENFGTWTGALGRRRQLVVPDLPGNGESAPLPGPHTAAALAGAVLQLADELELRRFDLGGLCLGVPVALEVARQRPGAVERLLLHTPLLAAPLVRPRFHRQVRAVTLPGAWNTVVWLSRQRWVSDLYKRLVVEGPNADPSEAAMNFRNQCRAHPRAAREWLRDGLSGDRREFVASARHPTLMIAGNDDRIVDVPQLSRMAQRWPEAQLAIIEDAGHGWTPAYVRQMLEAIEPFLR